MAQRYRAMPRDDHVEWRKLASWLPLIGGALGVLACNFPNRQPTPVPFTATPQPSPIPAMASPAPTPTIESPYPNANSIMAGVCFSFLQTLDGTTVVLDSERDLSAFYDQVDKSKRCRDPVPHQQFDFSTRQIVGTVLTGEGCAIDLAYDHTDLDENTHQRTIGFRAAVSGDCAYDLVRPIWLSIERPASGYTTNLQISKSS